MDSLILRTLSYVSIKRDRAPREKQRPRCNAGLDSCSTRYHNFSPSMTVLLLVHTDLSTTNQVTAPATGFFAPLKPTENNDTGKRYLKIYTT